MKSTLTKLILLLFSNHLLGQENSLNTKLIDKNYSYNNVTSEQLDSVYFNLQSIQSTKYKSHFRISFLGQIIDLFCIEDSFFYGKLINYTTEYDTKKNKDTHFYNTKKTKYYFEQIDLEQSKVDKTVEQLINTAQHKIPTDSLIKNWQHLIRHCNSLVFEYNFSGKYIKQTFHCPWGQADSVEFKNNIINYYLSLKSTLNLDSIYESFEGKLPSGKTYSNDGYRMMYRMTERQIKNFSENQSQREFMKSIKDTVDKYINSELIKLDFKLRDINCFSNFQLIFGKNGKLKTVHIKNLDKPTLKKSLGLGDYLSQKQEIRKCENNIKEIISNIDLSFLNLKSEIYRTIKFNFKNQYQLKDETIY